MRTRPYVALAMFTMEDTVVLESVAFQTEPYEVVFEDDPPPQPQDRIAQLEQKLDAAIRMIAAMQQRIESLDTTLMLVLTRR